MTISTPPGGRRGSIALVLVTLVVELPDRDPLAVPVTLPLFEPDAELLPDIDAGLVIEAVFELEFDALCDALCDALPLGAGEF